VSGNVSATSNYIWRGVSQTGNAAAVQGGIDWNHDSGFYVGTWTSTLGGDLGYELDGYLGFGNEIGEFGYDVGYIYYAYPVQEDVDFSEVYLSGSWKWLELGLAYTVDGQAPDDSAFIGGDMYYYAGLSFDLPQDWGLGLTLGSYNFDADSSTNELNYVHYQVAVTKGDFTFAIDDNDLKDEFDEDTDPLVSVSWGTTF
jgi:uncharacterized protein (TIGR02001 family)